MKRILLVLILGMFLISFANAFDWNSGITSYYKLDEAASSTGTIIDSVGILNGTNSYADNTTGKIQYAYDFNGTGDYINLNGRNANTSNDFSINVWANSDTLNTGLHMIFDTRSAAYNAPIRIYQEGTAIKASTETPASNSYTATFVTSPTGWHMYSVVYTASTKNMSLFYDGSYVSSYIVSSGTATSNVAALGTQATDKTGENFDGKIDELGIWNRKLASSEISELYNESAGLPYGDIGGPMIYLSSPSNNSEISDIGTYFVVNGSNISRFGATWKNLTYILWNGTVLHNQTTVSLSNQTFINSLFIDDFGYANYTWTAIAYYNNTTGDFKVNTSNYTLSVVPFALISQNYSTAIIEGTTGTFAANFSFLSGYRMSRINLIYNGTSYPAVFNEYTANYYYVEKQITIPSVTSDTNISFIWNITLESGLSIQTDATNQTILNIAIDNCGTYTNQLFNFTLVDEDTQVPISMTGNTTGYIKVDMQFKNPTSGAIIINYSSRYNNTNNARVCSGSSIGNSTFALDGQIEYFATNRYIEFYNIKNYTLNTTTTNQNITLYDLNNSGGGIPFKISYKNTNFRNVPGAVVQIKRKYVDEGVFKVVELPMIGADGFAIAHIIPSDAIYSIVVVEEGEVLDSFENIVAYCPNFAFSECVINLNSYGSAITPGSFDNQGDFSSVLTYNKTSRVITATFVIPSGATSTVVLNATKADAIGTTLVCNDTLTASGGTLTCTIPPSIGNTTIKVYLTADGEVKKWFVMSLGDTPAQLFGANLIFLGVIMMLFFIGIGVQQDPKIMAGLLVFGLIVLSAINIITSSSWIGKGATILWFLAAIIIIIIKSENNR